MEQIVSSFAERLTELMFYDNNISAQQLGFKLGIDASTIRGWKTGRGGIALFNLLKIADYFDCSLEFLAGKGREDKKLDYTPKAVPPFYSRFLQVLAENDKTRYRLVKEKIISGGNVSSWKRGASPNLQTLIILSDYFGYTLDHFVGREKL